MNKDLKNYKTTICRHYLSKGYCSLFQKCYFAHGKHEVRAKVDPIPPIILPQYKPISIYKTQLCNYFMKGYCRNDQRCPFAHGHNDLHGMVVITSTSNPPIATSMPLMTVKPDYGQAGEFLFSIFRNLSQVFPQQTGQKVLIKKGIQLIQTGDLPEANQIINELVSSKHLSEKQQQQCQTILANAYSLHKINFMQF